MKHSRPAYMGTPAVLVGTLFETNGTNGPMQIFPLLPCNNPRRNTSMNYLTDDDPRLWAPLDSTFPSATGITWSIPRQGQRLFACRPSRRGVTTPTSDRYRPEAVLRSSR